MTRSDTIVGLFALAALCGAPTLGAQEPTPPAAERKAQSEADIQALIEKLGAPKNADRKAAEGELTEIGEPAREALERAVQDHDDPEVRWRARRVLRKLDGHQPRLERRGEPGAEQPAPEARGQDQDVQDEVRELMERMHRAFGEDFGRLRGLEDLQRQMDEMRKQFEQMERGFGGPGPGFRMRGGPMGQGVQIQVGPDGVRVEVQEQGEDGKTKPKVYEAESMEAFREKYPEVAERYFPEDGGFGFRSFGRGLFEDTDRDGLPDARVPGFRPIPLEPIEVVPEPDIVAPPPEGERLGVYLGDLAPAVREFLEIPPGRGILVEEVEEGSLAAALGIRAKDVVVKIGDREIDGAGDVRTALRAIPKGEEVAVVVNRRGKVLTLTAKKRADAPAEAGGLRKREAGESKDR